MQRNKKREKEKLVSVVFIRKKTGKTDMTEMLNMNKQRHMNARQTETLLGNPHHPHQSNPCHPNAKASIGDGGPNPNCIP
jgi:hypothetical protein